MRKPIQIKKRRRRRSERQRPRQVAFRSAMVLSVVALFIYVAMTATQGVPGVGYYNLKADFADAKGLVRGSQVWIAGHQVGQVRGSDVRNGVATLDLQLSQSEGPLPSDTSARLRYTSLLGAKVVELTPGIADTTLPEDGRIARKRTSSATELADVFTALDAKRRPQLRTTLSALGSGFAGRGADLNAAISSGPDFFGDAEAVSRAVLARRGAARRFFPSLQSLSAAADPVRDDVAQGLEPQADVFDAIADQRPAVERLLDVAPADLSGIHGGLARTDPLLVEAAGFSRAVRRTLTPAPTALRQTRELLREARSPLERLAPVLRRARTAVPAVLDLTRKVDPIIGRVREGVTAPLAGLDRFSAYTCDFLTWARNWRSMLGYGSVGQPGPTKVGPSNFLRVEIEALGTATSYFGGKPFDRHRTDPAPPPCAAQKQKVVP